MKSPLRRGFPLLLIVVWLAAAPGGRAQGTAFTYQGMLDITNTPAQGLFDLTFQLFSSLTNGLAVGPMITNSGVTVSNGLFTTTLDFGAGVFTGSNDFVQIGARTNGGGAFTTLAPRLPITPVPYAITAENANNAVTASNAVTAAALSGTVAGGGLSGTYSNAVTLNSVSNSFTGNGAGLSNVNAATVGGVGATNLWLLNGNAGTTAGAQFLGTTDSNALELHVDTFRALRLEPGSNGLPNVIGGSETNEVDPGVFAATIGGGDHNTIQLGANGSTISGGVFCLIASNSSDSTVSGGSVDIIQSNSTFATVGGGNYNTISSGSGNSFIGGGSGNLIQSNSPGAVIAGGTVNNLSGAGSFIGGGGFVGVGTSGNIITGTSSVITGGVGNSNFSNEGVIGGGSSNNIQTNSDHSVVAGGGLNAVQAGAANSVISGGNVNTIQSAANNSVIAGGANNTIQSGSADATIAGGAGNTIQTNAAFSVIAGGSGNTISSNLIYGIIGGGNMNGIQGNSSFAVVAGGLINVIQAGGSNSVIAGGAVNTIDSNSTFSAIGGGAGNTVESNAVDAIIPGGSGNVVAGSYAMAVGQQAHALHQGAFVWADSQNAPFASTNADSFNVRAQGGVIFSDGNTNSVSWTPASGAWNFASDRNLKEHFAPVNDVSILEKVARLPVTEWNYKGHEQRHIGAMAQDFHALFPFNNNDKALNEVDLHGVELSAIKGLNEKVDDRDQKLEAQLKAKDEQIENLRQQVADWEKRFQKLEETVDALAGKPAQKKQHQ